MNKKRKLQIKALQIRALILEAIAIKGGGHIGGSADLAEFFAVLYDEFMRIDPMNPAWSQRDYFVCSKGHAGPALYAALALKGYFDVSLLKTLNQEGTTLPGHCDRMKVPGVDATSGSLGQGLSIAAGLAVSVKLSESEQMVYCMTGDGESAEGQIWEAALFANHYKLDNLIAFLDWNKMQIDGRNDDVMSLGNISEKYKAFGWDTEQVCGSDVSAIYTAIDKHRINKNGKPKMIILDTIKGFGMQNISSLENNHCIGVPNDMFEKAQLELNEQAKQLGVEIQWLR